MKPDTRTAMQNLIDDVRSTMPFDMPETQICSIGVSCHGCPLKLLEFLAMELDDWQSKLDDAYVPDFGDLTKLARISRKIHTALEKSGLVSAIEDD